MTAPAQQQQTLKPEMVEQLRILYSNQAPPDDAVRLLQAAGADKLQSIKLLRAEFNLPLADAKRLVHNSPAWKDSMASDNDLHEVTLLAALSEGFTSSVPPEAEKAPLGYGQRKEA